MFQLGMLIQRPLGPIGLVAVVKGALVVALDLVRLPPIPLLLVVISVAPSVVHSAIPGTAIARGISLEMLICLPLCGHVDSLEFVR